MTYKKIAVRTTNLTNPVVNLYGYLSSFRYGGKKYTFLRTSAFRQDQHELYETALIQDYYDVDEYALHMANPQKFTLAKLKEKHRFDFSDFQRAEPGDTLIVNRVNTEEPYTFYKRDTYSATYADNVDYIKNNKIDLSLFGTPQSETVNMHTASLGFFNNHISFAATIPDEQLFVRTLIKTSLWIGMTIKNIFPKFIQASTGYTHQSTIQNMIDSLETSWTTELVVEDLTLEDLQEYYLGLKSFYKSCFKRMRLIEERSVFPLFLFLKILSVQSLEILPLSFKIFMLDNYMKEAEIVEQDERLISKLILSISSEDADDFLDYLLIKKSDKNNFEILYNLVTDERLTRVINIPWVMTEEWSNRKTFNYAIFELWKSSKYNFYHLPADADILDENINEQCFFLNEGLHYFENNSNILLEYSVIETTNHVVQTQTATSYHPHLVRGEVKVWEIRVYTNSSRHVSGKSGYSVSEEYGTYHLFQPLSLVGYRPDLELQLPDYPMIPAFLFAYMEEFDDLKDIDAAISFGIEVAFEVILFFATGGLGNLRHLRHLKHVTNIGKALRGALKPADAVRTFKASEAALETISISAGVLHATSAYVANTTNDQDTYELAKSIGNFLLILTLTSAGGTALSRRATLKAADEVLADVTKLPAGVSHGLDDEFLKLLKEIKGTKKVTLTFFRNKLKNLVEAGEQNHLLAKFNALPSDNLRMAFQDEFSKLDDVGWKKLNTENGIGIDNWQSLKNINAADRTLLDIITNQARVDTLLRFFVHPDLRREFEFLTIKMKIKFLDDFQSISGEDLLKLNNFNYGIKWWSIHPPSVMKDIGANIGVWLKHQEAIELLKQGKYEEIAELFGYDYYKNTITSIDFPGVNYIRNADASSDFPVAAAQIANRTDDVALISTKTGIPEEVLQIAKENYFVKERFVLVKIKINGIEKSVFQKGRFSKFDADITEWERAISGDLIGEKLTKFKYLIAHEYIEARLIDDFNLNYSSFHIPNEVQPFNFGAHDLSPLASKMGYSKLGINPDLPKPLRFKNPPKVNINELNKENLDKIVDWFHTYYIK